MTNYYPSDAEHGLIRTTSASAIGSPRRNIPRGSVFRVILNSNGKYSIEERTFFIFWFDVWFRNSLGILFKEFDSEYEAINTLQRNLDRVARAGVVAYLNEDGDIT